MIDKKYLKRWIKLYRRMLKYYFHRGICYPNDTNWYVDEGQRQRAFDYITKLDQLALEQKI